MAVVIASDLAKDMAGEPLLRGVSFKLERRDRLTLSGRNGSGKTTLLRMLSGESGIDGGELVFAKDVKVALHDQRPPRDRDFTLRDYVLSGCQELLALEERMASLEQAMADGAMDAATLDAYAARAGAARARRRLQLARGRSTRRCTGSGSATSTSTARWRRSRGGELTRASLARALAGDPDLLLLDEPTNHLDIESLEWLEAHLQSLDAAVVLVAHDRWFLEAVGTSVLELEAGRAKFFKGTWHAWRAEKAQRELALGRAIEKQQAEIAKLERFVDRFRAGTRAKQAQSRAKKLEQDRSARRATRRTASRSGSRSSRPSAPGRVVFELEDGELKIGSRVLLRDAELWLERAEHVSLVGANGSGKTTLITALTGGREFDGGKLRRGHNVKLGLLAQHADDLQGATGTVLEACQRATKLTPNNARALLGRFLFSGEEAEKPLDGLSGGERQRLSLAILVHSGANVLILDEPTNHLDLESREALEDALQQFQGALLLISHDRALLDAVGTRTVAVEDQTLHSYVGGWPEYVRVREERAEAERDGEARQAGAEQAPPPKPKPRGALQERGRAREEARGPDRGRRGRARRAGGGTGRPGAWNDPRSAAEVHRPPRRGQARAGGPLRALGGRRRLSPEHRATWRRPRGGAVRRSAQSCSPGGGSPDRAIARTLPRCARGHPRRPA